MKIVVISASPRKTANTQIIMKYVNEYTKSKNSDTKFINLSEGEIECYRGFDVEYNEATKKKIKESFDEEKKRSSQIVEEPKKSKYLSFKLEGILESPVNLCVTYDPTKFGPFVIGRSSIPEAGLYSVCCAIQNLWLSARTEGVGLGWVSILSNDVLKETLGLPEHVVPVAYLCLGYVNEFADKPDLETARWLPRLDLKDVVYYEKWEDKENLDWKEIQDLIQTDLD